MQKNHLESLKKDLENFTLNTFLVHFTLNKKYIYGPASGGIILMSCQTLPSEALQHASERMFTKHALLYLSLPANAKEVAALLDI